MLGGRGGASSRRRSVGTHLAPPPGGVYFSGPPMSFTDAWLTTALEPLLPAGKLDELRPAPDQPSVSLWQKVTSEGLLTEEQVLKAAAERYRFPLAELAGVQASKVKDAIPESLARRFGLVP